ncbi:MAG: ABC transporter permease [Armatimonadetes bacterium]|nr:ABC transporter permease [Armatimonadota bacterium]
MSDVWLLARYQIEEALAKKLFYIVVLMGLVLVGGVFFANTFELGHQGRVVRDASLSVIGVFSLALTLLLTLQAIPREIENRTIYPILARPLSRFQYLLGKELGIALVVGASLSLFYGLLLLLLFLKEGSFPVPLLGNALCNWLECVVISSFSFLLSVLVSPPLNFCFTIVAYFLGHFPVVYVNYILGRIPPVSGFVVETAKFALPQLEYLDIKTTLLYGDPISPLYFVEITLYALLYSGVLLYLAVLFFERKDL